MFGTFSRQRSGSRKGKIAHDAHKAYMHEIEGSGGSRKLFDLGPGAFDEQAERFLPRAMSDAARRALVASRMTLRILASGVEYFEGKSVEHRNPYAWVQGQAPTRTRTITQEYVARIAAHAKAVGEYVRAVLAEEDDKKVLDLARAACATVRPGEWDPDAIRELTINRRLHAMLLDLSAQDRNPAAAATAANVALAAYEQERAPRFGSLQELDEVRYALAAFADQGGHPVARA